MVKVQKHSPKTLKQNNEKRNNPMKKSNMKQTKKVTSKQSPNERQKEKLEQKEIISSDNSKIALENCLVKRNKSVDQHVKAHRPKVAVSREEPNAKKIIEKRTPNKQQKKYVIEPQIVDSAVAKNQKRKLAINTFNNNQKKKRSDGELNKKQDTTVQFETVPFDEQKFNVILTSENIKKIANALKELVEKEVAEKKTSIFSDFRYFLNVSCYKIANCPKRMVKLNLTHSLVDTSTDDVVFIVPDLKRGAKVDYEPTIQHYEDLLREIGFTNIKIVPFNQLRNECTTFEAKRKFANTYDYFLCDGRIVSHVVGFCGKIFQKPRTTFHAVRLDNPTTYKSDIERALKRTSYKQIEKGDLISIPVGNHRFTDNQLADNIQLVVEQIKDIFPGGYANIRNIHIKIDIKGTSSIPLYVSLAGAPLETPNVIGIREKQMLTLKKKANAILSNFNLSKTGDIVKLNKTQIKRKQEILEARASLLTEEPIDVSNDNNKAISTSKRVGKKIKNELTKQIKNKKKLAKKDDHDESEDDISNIAEGDSDFSGSDDN